MGRGESFVDFSNLSVYNVKVGLGDIWYVSLTKIFEEVLWEETLVLLKMLTETRLLL